MITGMPRPGRAPQNPHPSALLPEAGIDEQRDRHQRIAADEIEEGAEDHLGLEQRVDQDVDRAARRERDADRDADHQQDEHDDADDDHASGLQWRSILLSSSAGSSRTVRPRIFWMSRYTWKKSWIAMNVKPNSSTHRNGASGSSRLSVRVSYFWLSMTSGIPPHTPPGRNGNEKVRPARRTISAALRARGPTASASSRKTVTLRCDSLRCAMQKKKKTLLRRT